MSVVCGMHGARLLLLAGLLLSMALAVLSSRRTMGLAARRLRWFVTPEERAASSWRSAPEDCGATVC